MAGLRGHSRIKAARFLRPSRWVFVAVGMALAISMALGSAQAVEGDGDDGTVAPLRLAPDGNQIAWGNLTCTLSLYELDSEADTYVESWTGRPPPRSHSWGWHSTAIADVDNDGEEELLGVTGRIHIFEQGATEEPTLTIQAFRSPAYPPPQTAVVNVDSDPDNELVIGLEDRVEFWECTDPTGSSPSCERTETRLVDRYVVQMDVADTDGDGIGEVVFGAQSVGENADGFVLVDSDSGWIESEHIGPHTGGRAASVTQLAHGDLDDDGRDEIVASLTFFADNFNFAQSDGGVAVWDDATTGYELRGYWIPDEAGYAGGGVDVGDLDGDGVPEIVASFSHADIHVLDANLDVLWSGPDGFGSQRLRVGDTDNDGALEFVAGTHRGFEIYEFSGTTRGGKLDFFLTFEKFEEARYDPETNRTIRHETQSISIH